MPNDLEKREGRKLFFDLVKQVTTLDTVSLVIIGAYTKNVFTSSEWRGFFIGAIVSFVASLVLALPGMATYAGLVYKGESLGGRLAIAGVISVIASIASFFFGIFLIVVYAYKNL